MALKAGYQRYLASANADALSENASLHYISTLTTINTATAIARHNAAHAKLVKKKQETILNCIEGQSALCLDVDTTLEFLSGGGAYLPGLDDNFVADRTVNFPMVHIVEFDSLQKIKQIRLYWDQGSLLKQVDVIGARARNWPIRDGKDQARLIATSASYSEQDSRPSTAASQSSAGHESIHGKPRSQSNNVTRDPHASLGPFASHEADEETTHSKVSAARGSAKPPPRPYGDLFVGDDPEEENRARSRSPKKNNGAIAPKAQSAKPPPRDYHDLFVGEDSPPPKGSLQQSPSKSSVLSPAAVAKSGAGKNYQPSRLFETDDQVVPSTPRSPEKGGMKPHPNKYHHFDFGDGENAPVMNVNRPKTKHQSQWDFEDFATPAKPPPKSRAGDQAKRHFGWDEDESVMDSPVKHPAVAKPRPDATSSFEFQDDGTPKDDKRTSSALAGTSSRATGLYQDNFFGEEDQVVPSKEKTQRDRSLSSITNVKDRNKTFGSQFEFSDQSPSQGEEKKITTGRTKARNDIDSYWDMADNSPAAASNKGNAKLLSSNKENMGHGRGGNSNAHVGIKSGGDGMGGKAGSRRAWGFGDDSDSG